MAYIVQAASLTLYKQYKTTNVEMFCTKCTN